MRLTIIRDMGLVHIDGRGYDEIDMTGVPDEIHALQWDGEKGEIEYVSSDKPNELVSVMPSWASAKSSEVYAMLAADDKKDADAKAAHEAYLASDQYKKDTAIAESKEYLSSTDWVVVKISEVSATGDASALISKYSDILAKRAEARDTINANGG